MGYRLGNDVTTQPLSKFSITKSLSLGELLLEFLSEPSILKLFNPGNCCPKLCRNFQSQNCSNQGNCCWIFRQGFVATYMAVALVPRTRYFWPKFHGLCQDDRLTAMLITSTLRIRSVPSRADSIFSAKNSTFFCPKKTSPLPWVPMQS